MIPSREHAVFDPLALDYDLRFSERVPAKILRAAVHRRIKPLIAPGNHVLDFGCGTATDAIWLAEHGCYVWATDVSVAMLEVAREKVSRSGHADRIALSRLDFDSIDESSIPGDERFDFMLSNFGALNCVRHLDPLFATMRCRLVPNGFVAVTLMGRFCLSETVYFLTRGQARRAARRWRGCAEFEAGGRRLTIWYHAPKAVLRAANGFEMQGVYAVGAAIPNSEAFDFCERHPRLFGVLCRLERRCERLLYRISDHYLLVLRRRD